jgi:hypothetical protein
MRKFDQETAIAAVELQQMVTDYLAILDGPGGGAGLDFFTEDVEVKLGTTISYTGRTEMKKFFEGVAERLRAEKDGRTSRHGYVNFKVTFPEKNRATVTVISVSFAGSGKPPLLNATTPSAVTDVRWECRREADGQWRIFGYYSQPIFVGNNPPLLSAKPVVEK